MSLGEPAHTADANQASASDPGVSAWVSANAGTGKTTVLVRRVLRLLLHRDAGGRFTRPETILCLTYTKAAAAEMKNRLFHELSEWASLDDQALDARLARHLGGAPEDAQRRRARALFATTLDTRGGLKIYTIHAFCERLLQRFPLEAGVAAGFEVLDEIARRALLDAAIDGVLERAWRPEDALNPALSEVIAAAGEDTFRDLVDTVLGRRETLRDIVRRHEHDGFAEAERDAAARLLGVPEGADEAELQRDMAGVLDAPAMRAAAEALEGGAKTDRATAAALRETLAADSPERRAEALGARLLTQEGRPRKRLVTKAIREAHPDLAAGLEAAAADYHALALARAGLAAANASGALLALADAIIDDYERAKRARAALDYDDLIARTAGLLTVSSAAAWVLYKLDYGIDHLLVDEAQDTSPAQWRVIDALTEEFFAGAGAGRAGRTVFAVGDEKQSIYSFQGADPAAFSAQGRRFAGRVEAAKSQWQRLPLTVSFRSTEAVLECVDTVFAREEAARGLSFDGAPVSHEAMRAGEAGLVELWETEKPEETEAAAPFRPHEESVSGSAPADRLAGRIAATIRGWLDGGERLRSKDRAIRPGDILVLVPRRGTFTRAMIRALKARSVPVAGTDRMVLTEQLAVMDLMALGDFLLMAEDDLALATVLKSPLFGLDDDDLFALARERRGSLWAALRDKAGEDVHYAEAAARLERYRARADYKPPYEFFAELLDEDGMAMRHRLIARLGPDAGDAIDEFLNLALDYEREAPPSLQGFLAQARTAEAEVKRDMEQERDEVRVMTVYGAKGLEAEIVFLPDTCAIPHGRGGATILDVPRADAPPGAPPHIVWVPPDTAALPDVEDAKETRKQTELREYQRLLYVAMTRARDRLYVCGWEGARKRGAGCWYDLVSDGLAELLVETTDAAGRTVWRYERGEEGHAAPEEPGAGARPEPVTPPEWAQREAPREPPPALPVAPSAIAQAGEGSESGALSEPPALPPDRLAEDSRFLRGALVHALLQHLPALAPDARAETARAYVAARGAGLDAAAQAAIVDETLAVLDDPPLAPLFAPDSLPEVPLAARIERDSAEAPALDVNGRIDRLAVLDNAVLIVDYKTNRPPPERVEEAAAAHVAQLAAYRIAVAALFPEKRVRAALLWTDGPRLMEIPEAMLEKAEAAIRAGGSP